MTATIPLISAPQRTRLHGLANAWEMRARGNTQEQEAQILRQNTEALKAALASAEASVEYRERIDAAAAVLDEIRAALDEFAKFKGPRPKRADMARLANRVQDAYSALEY